MKGNNSACDWKQLCLHWVASFCPLVTFHDVAFEKHLYGMTILLIFELAVSCLHYLLLSHHPRITCTVTSDREAGVIDR